MKFLIKNATIITQNASREVLPRADISIENGTITAIGQNLPVNDSHIIEAEGTIVSPGFINVHVHLGETAYAPFMPQRVPLDNYIQQTEAYADSIHAIEDARQTIASYSLLQLLRTGTTTIGGGRTAAIAQDLGVRNVSGYMLMQSKKLGRFSNNITTAFRAEQSTFTNKLTTHALFIHSLHTIDKEILPEVAALFTTDKSIRLMIHVAESSASKKGAEQKWGMSEITVLKAYNLLNSRTLIIHGNHLSKAELHTIKKHGAALAHCPTSNMNTADNTLSLPQAVQTNVTTAIATDGVVTGSDFSILREANATYQYHNRFKRNDTLTAQQLFDMITITAAKALGLDRQTGSIEVEKAADITIHHPPFPISSINPVEQLIYYAPLASVRDVFIQGRRVIANSQPISSAANIERDFRSILQSIATMSHT